MEEAGLCAVTQLAAAAAPRLWETWPAPKRHVRQCWTVGSWRTAVVPQTAWRSVWNAAPSASLPRPIRAGSQDVIIASLDVYTLGLIICWNRGFGL